MTPWTGRAPGEWVLDDAEEPAWAPAVAFVAVLLASCGVLWLAVHLVELLAAEAVL